MKLALFGSTGHIGSRVLRHAIAGGHMVRAFARHPDKLGTLACDCQVVQGDLDNREAVIGAIRDTEAVIVCLAAGNGALAQFDSVALPFMRHHGPRRIVSLVGAAVRMPGDPDRLSLKLMTIMMSIIPTGLLRDAERHASDLMLSGLDWTLVRAANFADLPGHALTARPGYAMRLGAKVDRDALARFILDCATDARFSAEAPMVASAG